MSRKSEFSRKEILESASAVLRGRKICDHCLGRQFAQVSTGMTNDERGRELRKLLKEKEPPDFRLSREHLMNDRMHTGSVDHLLDQNRLPMHVGLKLPVH